MFRYIKFLSVSVSLENTAAYSLCGKEAPRDSTGSAKRDLLAKVENLLLKNYLHSVVEQLMLEEEKNEQLITLQKQLKCVLKRGEPSDWHTTLGFTI